MKLQKKVIFKQYGLDQVINKPTRYSAQKDSCLDLICTNSDHISNVCVCNINLSDHEMVLITRKKVKIKQEKITFIGRSYKNYDKAKFSERLLNQNWDSFNNENNNPELLWNTIVDNITKSIDNMCPLKTFKVRSTDKPWFTNEILEQIKDKDRALKRAKKSGKNDDWKLARRLRNDCLKEVRRAKSNFIQDELNTNWNDSKKFWQQINTILPKNANSSTIKLMDGNTPVNISNIPNFINDYFTKIGPNLAETLKEPWVYDGDHPNSVLPDITTTCDEVKGLIKGIDISKASAITDISSKIVKDAFEVIPLLLTNLFNLSLTQGSP